MKTVYIDYINEKEVRFNPHKIIIKFKETKQSEWEIVDYLESFRHYDIKTPEGISISRVIAIFMIEESVEWVEPAYFGKVHE